MRCIHVRPALLSALLLTCIGLLPFTPPPCIAIPLQQPTANAVKPVGTIKAINGTTIALATDAGTEMTVQVDPAARILLVEAGEKDLKNATVIQLGDLQVGDRMIVRRGKLADDGKAVAASEIIAVKHTDVAAKQEHDREEWQRHGTDGLVTAVDRSAGTITISNATLAGKRTTLIRVSSDTVIRRYAPDSVKFDDAKPATLDQIKTGDQLRARGTRSQDGNELEADEVVAGTFHNIAGTVISADPATKTVSVMDAITNKAILVRFSAESQARKLPREMAQQLAMRFKGETSDNGAGPSGSGSESASTGTGQFARAGGPGGGPGQRRGGTPDFQQVLNRLPQIGVKDLQKGDAVIILSTEGANAGAVTAIKLLSGVEPILAAAPKGSEGMVLSPWTLGGGGGEETQ